MWALGRVMGQAGSEALGPLAPSGSNHVVSVVTGDQKALHLSQIL